MSTRIVMQYLPMTLWYEYEYFLLEFLFLEFLSSSPLTVFNILLTDMFDLFCLLFTITIYPQHLCVPDNKFRYLYLHCCIV